MKPNIDPRRSGTPKVRKNMLPVLRCHKGLGFSTLAFSELYNLLPLGTVHGWSRTTHKRVRECSLLISARTDSMMEEHTTSVSCLSFGGISLSSIQSNHRLCQARKCGGTSLPGHERNWLKSQGVYLLLECIQYNQEYKKISTLANVL